MTEYVIRLWSVAGEVLGSQTDKVEAVMAAVEDRVVHGEWLESFDVEAHGGRGEAQFTDRVERAMRFPSMGAAMEAYKTQSKTRPARPDGRPNRPLTAFNVTFDPVPRRGPVHVLLEGKES